MGLDSHLVDREKPSRASIDVEALCKLIHTRARILPPFTPDEGTWQIALATEAKEAVDLLTNRLFSADIEHPVDVVEALLVDALRRDDAVKVLELAALMHHRFWPEDGPSSMEIVRDTIAKIDAVVSDKSRPAP